MSIDFLYFLAKFYLKISPYPDFLEQKKIIFSIRQFSPDIIVVVGGGSVLDYAKIINIIQNDSDLDNQIIKQKVKIKKKIFFF